MFAFGNLDPAMREKLYRLEPVAMLSKSYVSGAVKVLQGRGLCGKGGVMHLSVGARHRHEV